VFELQAHEGKRSMTLTKIPVEVFS